MERQNIVDTRVVVSAILHPFHLQIHIHIHTHIHTQTAHVFSIGFYLNQSRINKYYVLLNITIVIINEVSDNFVGQGIQALNPFVLTNGRWW